MSVQSITLGNKGVLEYTYDLCIKAGHLEGDFCEAGVAYGGQLVNMHSAHPTKKIYAFDSFQGIAQHGDNDYEFTQVHGKGTGDPRKSNGVTVVSLEMCKENVRRFVPDLSRFVFVEGWFIDTLPKLTDEKFCVVRLDGDVYESYVTCLKYLYPRLVTGGYLIIDDFVLSGCKQALNEYFSGTIEISVDKNLGNAYIQKQ